MIDAIVGTFFTPDGPTVNPQYQPPKRTWVGLTDDEIAQAIESINMLHGDYATEVAYAIESKLKELNT